MTINSNGSTYYVTTVGSDSYNGTVPVWTSGVTGPKATIQAGITLLRTSDTLNVGAGTYDERIVIPSDANGLTWESPTTIQGTNVTIDYRPDDDSYLVNRVTCVQFASVEYLVFSGINIDLSNYPAGCEWYGVGLCSPPDDNGNGGPGAMAIQAGANHVRIQNLKILGPPHGMGIIMKMDSGGYNEIISCVISNQGWGFTTFLNGETFYHPIYIESSNNLIDGCTLGPPGLGVRNANMDTDSKPSGLQIYDNKNGLPMTNNTVRNCTVNGPCRVGFTICGMPDGSALGGYNKFYNNVVSDCIYAAYISYRCGTNSIYNNTFYNCTNGIWHNDEADASGGTRIANNIFVNILDYLAYFNDSHTTSFLTNNIVYNCGPFHPGGDTTYEETGRINSDPLMVSPATGDFRLQSTSPAIGAGAVLSSLFTTDKNGVARGAAWDIGAYEYVSSTVTRRKSIILFSPL